MKAMTPTQTAFMNHIQKLAGSPPHKPPPPAKPVKGGAGGDKGESDYYDPTNMTLMRDAAKAIAEQVAELRPPRADGGVS